MRKTALICSALALAAPMPAFAQTSGASPVSVPAGVTRLDIAATGKVQKVPDLAIISTGVTTRAKTAEQAIADNADRLDGVMAALERAGIEKKDVRTASITLNPDYQYRENEPPLLTGYNASNQLSVRFRDIAKAGEILDALVSVGANQIYGPNLTFENPDAAYDEARMRALAEGQRRAEQYAAALGKRVVALRLVSETGSGGFIPPPPPPMLERGSDEAMISRTQIVPGQQELSVTLSMSFDLQ